MYIYIYVYTRRKDGAKTPSLLDHFGHFDVPVLDAKAHVFDPRLVILRSAMLKPRSSISDAEAPTLDSRSSMLR